MNPEDPENSRKRLRAYLQKECAGMNHLVYSMLWTPSLCYIKKCNDEFKNECGTWRLHGLWLNANDSSIVNCYKKRRINDCADEEELYNKHMTNEMKGYHTSKYEYYDDKHGYCVDRCLSDLSDESSLYKRSSVCQIGKLLQEYQIGDMLPIANITAGRFYSVFDIHDAIKEQTWKNPYIRALYKSTSDAETKKFYYIYEIYLYFDLDFNIEDCDPYCHYRSIKHGGKEAFTNMTQKDHEILIYYPTDLDDLTDIIEFRETEGKNLWIVDNGEDFICEYEKYKKYR